MSFMVLGAVLRRRRIPGAAATGRTSYIIVKLSRGQEIDRRSPPRSAQRERFSFVTIALLTGISLE
jgi:hypothetical protein